MPWLHRIACLRDDVVFLVYLYQKWIYKEDKRRRNEFGQVGDNAGEDEDVGVDEKLLAALERESNGGKVENKKNN